MVFVHNTDNEYVLDRSGEAIERLWDIEINP